MPAAADEMPDARGVLLEERVGMGAPEPPHELDGRLDHIGTHGVRAA